MRCALCESDMSIYGTGSCQCPGPTPGGKARSLETLSLLTGLCVPGPEPPKKDTLSSRRPKQETAMPMPSPPRFTSFPPSTQTALFDVQQLAWRFDRHRLAAPGPHYLGTSVLTLFFPSPNPFSSSWQLECQSLSGQCLLVTR